MLFFFCHPPTANEILACIMTSDGIDTETKVKVYNLSTYAILVADPRYGFEADLSNFAAAIFLHLHQHVVELIRYIHILHSKRDTSP